MGVLSAIRAFFPRAKSAMVPLRARYDAAQTTSENSAHWAYADTLGAATANNEQVRSKLRTRARYERANNCFAHGMIRTVAEHTIGTGPRLQCQTQGEKANQSIEREWEKWAKRINLADKLRTMRMAKCCDGEAFAMLTNNPAINVDVTLDLRLIEADQIQSPQFANTPTLIDGIGFDPYQNPTTYYLLDGHPGDALLGVLSTYFARPIPASQVLHWFRRDRPGQVRGIPEITPALPLYAVLRRYTLAVLHSAETAANLSVLLKTSGQIDPAEVEAWETLAIERNGMTTLPDGWEMQQLKAEQPTTAHDAFQRSLLREIARCLNMPYNIAAGDSSSYNYSSGKLDDQTWGRSILIDRMQCEIELLDRIFAAWRAEAELFGIIPRVGQINHAWQWPPDVDIDPLKEANAAAKLKDVGLLTDAEYWGRKQRDWRDVYDQRKREQDYAEEIGLKPGEKLAPQPVPNDSTQVDSSSRADSIDAGDDVEDSADVSITASGGPKYRFDGGTIRVNAIASEGDLPTFEMLAYTGGMLHFPQFDRPVVVDLATLKASGEVIPALRDHKLDQEVGHIPTIQNDGRSLQVAGVLSSTSDHQRRVVEAAKNGFAWQASIGADFAQSDFQSVETGQSVTVNGQSFRGPVYIARNGVLREVSFVSIGNDPGTAVSVAATYQGSNHMTFAEYCASLGIDPANLTEAGKAAIEAQMTASTNTSTTSDQDTTTTTTAGATETTVAVAASANLDFTATRAAHAAEALRIAEIQRLAAAYPGMAGQAANAIKDGTSPEKFELIALRASRAAGPAIHVAGSDGAALKPIVLQAAAMQALGARDLEASGEYTPQVLQAAHTAYRGRMGLHELLGRIAINAGYVGSTNFRTHGREILRAAFSSTEASNILSNVTNKFLLAGYNTGEMAWQQISAIRSVPDFKTAYSYRLNADMGFDKVAPDGKIKHGKISDVQYTNQVDTYGRMFTLTRKDLINDDLGALQAIPQQIGRYGIKKLNEVFWPAFYAGDGTFWHTSHTTSGDSGNSNKTTGAFASSTLATAESLFMMQVDTNGNPIGVMPKKLLVPPALKRKAMELMSSSNFVSGNTTKEPSANTFQGAYDVVVSSYLQNASYGNSSVIYYLLADPAELPVIEVAFLNGQQQPIVEEVDVDADMLGMSFRGYFDFGVAQQDFRGGVKSTGA